MSDHPDTAMAVSPLAVGIGRRLRRACDQLADDWALVAQTQVLTDPLIVDALAALDTLAALDADHQPHQSAVWADVVTCSGCHAPWPCITAQRIHPEENVR